MINTDRQPAREGRATTDHNDLLLTLRGCGGLHAFESLQIYPKHVKLTDDGTPYRGCVPKGEGTTGSGGKPRHIGSLTVRSLTGLWGDGKVAK